MISKTCERHHDDVGLHFKKISDFSSTEYGPCLGAYPYIHTATIRLLGASSVRMSW